MSEKHTLRDCRRRPPRFALPTFGFSAAAAAAAAVVARKTKTFNICLRKPTTRTEYRVPIFSPPTPFARGRTVFRFCSYVRVRVRIVITIIIIVLLQYDGVTYMQIHVPINASRANRKCNERDAAARACGFCFESRLEKS